MSKTIYDIFISYRRDGGGATAGRINDMLTADGYSVSYDVDTLREGRFDMQLLERIEQCQDFILVVDKNCFVRTIDPSTNPQDDWLWQELSYALQLKKNVIPVLEAGAGFPKKLPNDIDNVRYCNGPKCVHEYFDSFYTKLKEMLRAYPRLAKPTNAGQPLPTKNVACLKLKADMDCIFYLDGEERLHMKAGIIQKIPLAKGEYELMFVSEENGNDRLELEFVMSDVDKLQKVNLCDIKDTRLQKEAEAKRIVEEKRQTDERRKKEEVEARKGITQFKLAVGTNVGLVRTRNDDNFLVSTDLRAGQWIIPQIGEYVDLGQYGALLVVADGENAGGHVASAIAVETIQMKFSSDSLKWIMNDDMTIQRFLIDTVKSADLNIYNRSKTDKLTQGMTASVVLAWVLANKVYVCWCGNCRCYMYSNNTLVRLTKDHSYVQELVDKAIISVEEMRTHPLSNVLTRCLGSLEKRAQPEILQYELQGDETILLCSDGLYNPLDDLNICKVIKDNNSNLNVCKNELISAALKKGGDDNITVVALETK